MTGKVPHRLASGFAAFSLALATPPSAAQDSASDPAPAAEPERPEGEIVVEGEIAKKQKRVCMSETATGSIMSRRVCYTVAQLEERKRIAEHVKNELGKKQDRERHLQESRRNGT